MYQNDAKRILTPECRLSYCNLVNPDKNGKYSVTLLIPKTPEIIAEIRKAESAAEAEGVTKKWNGAKPKWESVVHDGDGLRDDGTPFGPECKGCYVLAAKTNNPVPVVHISNIDCELDPKDIYSGMYARVSINFYPYAHPTGGKGVTCGLRGVLKTRDGEPLGAGTVNAASEFAEFRDYGGTGEATPQINPITGLPY